MKTYSRADVVGLEQKYRAETSLFKKIAYAAMRTKNPHLRLQVPAALYYRADVFCKDVNRRVKKYIFAQEDLVDILFEDFTKFVRTNNANKAYNVLADLEKNPVFIKHYSSDYEVNASLIDSYHNSFEEIYVKCSRDEIERMEVLLIDIAELYPDHILTVERVLELLYCDFVEKLKNGSSQSAVVALVKKFEGE